MEATPAALPQAFGILPTGLPLITAPTSAPSQTSYIYVLPTTRPFNHISVFLLPGIELPPDTAAAVYINIPSPSSDGVSNAGQNGGFRFLGGIGPGKESAVFKVSGLKSGASTSGRAGGGEVDMDAPDTPISAGGATAGEITLGISIEPAAAVASQMAALSSPTSPQNSTSQALVTTRDQGNPAAKPDAVVLAQRIIKNAFNFLASFSGNVNGGVEVVPLKAFEEWWRKFEGRIRSDPGFLERDAE